MLIIPEDYHVMAQIVQTKAGISVINVFITYTFHISIYSNGSRFVFSFIKTLGKE